jgi:hypothetical protein
VSLLEVGGSGPLHVELYTTYNKFIHCCIKLDIHLPYLPQHSSQLRMIVLQLMRLVKIIVPKFTQFTVRKSEVLMSVSDSMSTLT